MTGRIPTLVLWTGFLALFSTTVFAQERWIYRYDGPGSWNDVARSIIMGSDGWLYVAGESEHDFTVVSLTDSGAERWVYRYGDTGGAGYSIAAGSDGNIYAAGYAGVGGGYTKFMVVGLTPSGAERWVYKDGDPWDTQGEARSIVMGSDGNIYACGYSQEEPMDPRFTVVSLNDSGVERWVYQYGGPGGGGGRAYAIALGSDGNLYAAGSSTEIGDYSDLTVVSLTCAGVERWIYRFDGLGNASDGCRSIVSGSDGNLYAAGFSDRSWSNYDMVVLSLTDSGMQRWVYRYNGPADTEDIGYSIVMGSDGNLYAAGHSYGSETYADFTVVSLTDLGEERWVYRYDGPENSYDYSFSIVAGSDGNLYAAGSSCGSGTEMDFTVVSLTDLGEERWTYRYDGPESKYDWAFSIVAGSDGNLYAAGSSTGIGTLEDFTVVSLGPDIGVAEKLSRPSASDCRLLQNSPNPLHHSTIISYSLPQASDVTLSVYDITGRLVETLVNETQEPGVHQVNWNRRDNPSGVYFYSLRAGEFVETRKMVVVE
jgi:uncharacterized delta-60 repeat protein